MNKLSYDLVYGMLLHFFVDLICVASVMSTTETNYFVVFLLIYNILAFGLQAIIGYYIDVTHKRYIGILGALMTFLGGLSISLTNFWVCSLILLGIGNAAFHVGTALDVMRKSDGRLFDLGLFVSTGAMGVAFGKITKFLWIYLGCLLFITIFYMYMKIHDKNRTYLINYKYLTDKLSYPVWLIIFLVFIGVFIRSMGSWVFPGLNLSGRYVGVITSCFVVTGKAFGGYLADNVGARKVGVLSLILSAILYVFGSLFSHYFILLGILCFNIVMSITTGSIISILSNYEGLAFGITTLALLLGTLPTFILGNIVSVSLSVFICLVAALIVYFSTSDSER